jgi:hypothetical protein
MQVKRPTNSDSSVLTRIAYVSRDLLMQVKRPTNSDGSVLTKETN